MSRPKRPIWALMSQPTDRRPPRSARVETARNLADLLVLSRDARDRIADALRFARDISDAEVAVVSMSDYDGNWYTASVGAEVPGTVQQAFCGRVARNRRPLIVLSTRDDPRFSHPACSGAAEFAESYVGFPLGHGTAELPGVLALINVLNPPSPNVTRRLRELTEQVSILLMSQPLRTGFETEELAALVNLDAPPSEPTMPALLPGAPDNVHDVSEHVASVRTIRPDVIPPLAATLATTPTARLLDNLDSFLDRDLGDGELPEVATCFIDISTFALMDEVLGEQAANQILLDLGERIRRHVRGEDPMARARAAPVTVFSRLSPTSIRRLAESLLDNEM